MDKQLVEKFNKSLSGNDKFFFSRVWDTPSEVYNNRLRAIGFEGLDTVLDAGFGMGQWLPKLSELNSNILGLEIDPSRFELVKKIINELQLENIKIEAGSIENLPYEDSSVDGIFSYSVIFHVDIKKALKEFYRVLKPQGKLYFTCNGLGWYLMCMVEEHNKSDSYNPREMAIKTIENTFTFLNEGVNEHGQLIFTPKMVQKELEDAGFEIVSLDGEGKTKINPDIDSKSFYQNEFYADRRMVYEVLAMKK